jgi:ABC-type nitrate/sulfonate/bicarbonate transport system ATPase subunit
MNVLRKPASSAPTDHCGSLIELRKVVKTYVSHAGSFTALKGIDLSIESGEFVAIVGK